MHLTSHYVLLSRNMQGPGVQVHTASQDEYITLTIHKCNDFDTNDFVEVNNDNDVTVRVQVGTSNVAITKSFRATENEIRFTDLPVKCGEDVWIATSNPNKYCVYGYSMKA